MRVRGATRLRQLARDGFLVLLAEGCDRAAAEVAAQDVPAPVAVVEIATLDPTGTVAAALAARPGEAWVLRPDAHVAAVVPVPALAAALRRALGDRLHPHQDSFPPAAVNPEEDDHAVLPQLR